MSHYFENDKELKSNKKLNKVIINDIEVTIEKILNKMYNDVEQRI